MNFEHKFWEYQEATTVVYGRGPDGLILGERQSAVDAWTRAGMEWRRAPSETAAAVARMHVPGGEGWYPYDRAGRTDRLIVLEALKRAVRIEQL